jgi:hypothetical protein
MTDLSRNLLTAAREGMTPSAEVMARVRAKVAASAAGAATGSVVAIPAKAATGLAAKLAIGVLLVSAIAATVVLATRTSSPGAISISGRGSDVEMAAPIHTMAGAHEQATPAAAAEPARPARAAEISLSREVALIDSAMQLVRGGDYPGALAVIATFDRESHGRGQMAEDAAAIDIEARCRLHESVGDRLARFDRAWPSSAQRSRLQSLCY